MDLRERIIWSADVASDLLLAKHVSGMPELQVVKLDRLYLTGRPLDVIDWVADELGRRVFVDAKIAEIASKVEAIAQKYLAHGPWMLNCMADIVSTGLMSGEDRDKLDALKRFADLCHAAGTLPCAVTVLTSKTEEIALKQFKRSTVDQVLWYLELLLAAGFTDVVCSPQEAAVIRAESRFDGLNINTPGIRRAGSTQHDQARIATPAGALAAGATRLVIGRDLTTGDPAANFQAILDEIKAAGVA